jgi:hypothetical protein
VDFSCGPRFFIRWPTNQPTNHASAPPCCSPLQAEVDSGFGQRRRFLERAPLRCAYPRSCRHVAVSTCSLLGSLLSFFAYATDLHQPLLCDPALGSQTCRAEIAERYERVGLVLAMRFGSGLAESLWSAIPAYQA